MFLSCESSNSIFPLPHLQNHHQFVQLQMTYSFTSSLDLVRATCQSSLDICPSGNILQIVCSNILEQKNALTKSLRNKNIPYRDFKVNKIEEETFGELFSYFISETALVGNLIGVDPFNQPAVEEVKNLTKHYLS